MGIKANIKMEGSRFPGDPDKWNLSVSGPSELMSDKKLTNILSFNGLSHFKQSEDGFDIWSMSYTPGPPMLYLALTLERRFRARLGNKTAIMLRDAINAHEPDDHLGGLLKDTVSRDAGNAPLAIRHGSQSFVANCSTDNVARQNLLEGAGWRPVMEPSETLRKRFGSRPYRTNDPIMASKLAELMSTDTRRHLGDLMRDTRNRIEAGKSHDAPKDFDVPAPDGLSYLPFQKRSIQTILDEGKSRIIGDDMGLGKTVQALGVMNGKSELTDMLVVCQANMRLKWVREIEKWKVNEELTVGHAEGNKLPSTNVVVINYDIITRHIDSLAERHWDLVVKDEAHNQSNPEAKRTVALMGNLLEPEGRSPLQLKRGGMVLEMTGTPKPNKVAGLWPLLTSTRPDIWGSGPEARRAFLNRYEPPHVIQKEITRGGRTFKKAIPLPGKPIRQQELAKRLYNAGMIRRLKADTELPAKFRTPIEIPVSLTKQDKEKMRQAEADLEAIGKHLEGRIAPGESRESNIIDTVVGAAATGAEFTELARLRRNLGMVKAPHAARFIVDELRAEDDFNPENRNKTVVFAHHKDVISEIARLSRETYPDGVRVFDGTMSNTDKQKAVDAFQEDPKVRLFIMSLSGATGITLTAAHRMRVAEMDYSASNMVQIEDRIWRIGQESNVDIGYLFIPDTLDFHIGNAVMSKMQADEQIINDREIVQACENMQMHNHESATRSRDANGDDAPLLAAAADKKNDFALDE